METEFYYFVTSAFVGILVCIAYIGYCLSKLNASISIIKDDIDNIHSFLMKYIGDNAAIIDELLEQVNVIKMKQK